MPARCWGRTWCWTPTSRCRTPSCGRRASAGSRYRAPGSSRPWSARATAPSWPRLAVEPVTRCARAARGRGAVRPGRAGARHSLRRRGLVDGQLLSLLNLKIGDLLNVGDTRLRIERVVSYEPDRGMQFVNVAPRVLLRASDLPATGLIAPNAAASATRCSSPARPRPCPATPAGWARTSSAARSWRRWNRAAPRCAARWTAPSASCRWWRCWPC